METSKKLRPRYAIELHSTSFPSAMLFRRRNERFENLPASQLHAREMKGTFPKIPFQGRTKTAIAMEITEPFSMFGICKVAISPIMNLSMPGFVLRITGDGVG